METSFIETKEASDSPFHASRLQQARDIRLLRVLNEESDTSKIFVEFKTVSLNVTLPTYHAISYCWGNPTPVDKVWFRNGRHLDLTASAAYIMWEIVRSRASDYFWIDALCINQKNSQEKSHQILLIREIFSYADQVRVYIGDSIDDDPKVIDFLKLLKTATKQLVERQNSFTMENVYELANCDENSSEWTSLLDFFSRPWFKRAWVIQEIVYANKPIIFYGGRSCEWDTAAYFLYHAFQNNLIQGLVNQHLTFHRQKHRRPDGINQVPLISNFRHRSGKFPPEDHFMPSWESNSITLENALLLTRGSLATDDRDKVIAMIGLAADLDLIQFNASYEESPKLLFSRTALHILTSSSTLDILGFAGIGFSRKLPSLPSWVPDFSVIHERYTLLLGYAAKWGGYRAARGTHSCIRMQTNSDAVAFSGHAVTRVASTSRRRPVLFFDLNDMSATKRAIADNIYWFRQTIRMVRALANKPAKYRTGENWIDAYWRTVICNFTDVAKPAPSNFCDSFRADIFVMWYFLLIDQNGNFQHYDENFKELVRAEANLYMPFRSALSQAGYRKFFITTDGLLALGPPGMADNDIVCVLLGGSAPFLLRESGKNGSSETTYTLVGECYVHGLMNGEGLDKGDPQPFIVT